MNNTVFTMETVPLKFGWGVIDELGYDLEALGARRVLLLTDPYLHELGLTERPMAAIRGRGIDVTLYAEARAEPTDISWQAAIDFALQEGEFDAFVALGGGSAIDTAKAVNLYTTHPAELTAYINKPTGEGRPVPGPLKPLIAIPTTAGTGSETTAVAVLDLLEKRVKTGISHRLLRPRLAIIDPELSMTMPRGVTAASGMDILCHALESYTSLPYDERPAPENPGLRPPYVGANPVADMWAGKAIEMGTRYLPRAFADGNDKEARTQLMLAATYAGMGFGNAGVHLPHAMSYPIAGMVRDFVPDDFPGNEVQVPHGMSVALGTPATFRFIGGRCPDKTLGALALMGVDTAGIAPEEAGNALADRVTALMRELGMPNGLSAVGYTEADIPALARGCAEQQRLLVGAPVPVNMTDIEALFRDSMTLW